MKLLKMLGCRLFQAGLKIGNYVLPYKTPVTLEGAGKLRELGNFLKEKGIKKPLIVTGAGMVKRGMVAPLIDGLEEAGIPYVVQTYEHSDPTVEDVEKGYKIFSSMGCQSVIGLGGGSRIDCAKAICAKAARPTKSVEQLQGLLKVRRRVPTLIAIPTTAGAGSETTIAAVITDSKNRKASINDTSLMPSYAVLDPTLTVKLPPYMTATSGMDAFAHAVEAYTNKTYNTKLENDLAKEAVSLIHNNLLKVYHDGSNLEARQAMQRGAFCAGRAFTRGCVGYVHAIGHTLGGLYGISHGTAMAVLLPKVMKAYGKKVYPRLSELAEVCGMAGENKKEKAENFIQWIENTNQAMGLPEGFHEIKDEDVNQMVVWADKEANPIYPVPVIWSKKDFKNFIESIRIQ